MDKLRPCPFCGNTETVGIESVMTCEECKFFEDGDKCPAFKPYYEEDDEDNCPFKAVVCTVSGGGCGGSSGWYSSAEKAIEAWNRRANK